MTNCGNCGVPISETPVEDGLHPVQMEYVDDGGRWCEACFFRAPDHGEYEHDGDMIVRASRVDLDDGRLAGLLAETFHANPLRKWMSAHGLSRRRGADKEESARLAVEQDRTLVAAAMERAHDLGGSDAPGYYVGCPCGLERHFGEEAAAVEFAEAHECGAEQEQPGLGGLSVWREADNARVWEAGA